MKNSEMDNQIAYLSEENDLPSYSNWNRKENRISVPASNSRGHCLEKQFVSNVYDSIAHHFDETRYSQWRNIRTFLANQPLGGILLDVGCGNGKYLNDDGRLIKLGCDSSGNLCSIVQKKGASVIQADALELPFRSNSFDCVISVAVIHHMSTVERRLTAISELIRVLRPHGQALITTWAFEQRFDSQQSAYLKRHDHHDDVDTANGHSTDTLLVHVNRTPFKQQDMLVPWQMNEQPDGSTPRFLRFYHLFKEGELAQLCSQIANCHILSLSYEQGNWVAIIGKI